MFLMFHQSRNYRPSLLNPCMLHLGLNHLMKFPFYVQVSVILFQFVTVKSCHWVVANPLGGVTPPLTLFRATPIPIPTPNIIRCTLQLNHLIRWLNWYNYHRQRQWMCLALMLHHSIPMLSSTMPRIDPKLRIQLHPRLPQTHGNDPCWHLYLIRPYTQCNPR